MNSSAQPSLSNSKTGENIRKDTDNSSLQLNINDEGENTDPSDDYECQPPETFIKRICSQTVKDIRNIVKMMTNRNLSPDSRICFTLLKLATELFYPTVELHFFLHRYWTI